MPIIQVLERLGEEDEQLQASMGTEQDCRRKGGSMRSSSHGNNISIRKESIPLMSCFFLIPEYSYLLAGMS